MPSDELIPSDRGELSRRGDGESPIISRMVGDLLALGKKKAEVAESKEKAELAEQAPGTVLWEFITGGGVDSSPAIGSDGTVYVGSLDKKLYAIHGKTGGKLWGFETGSDVQSSPAIGSDGTVYVGSDDDKLYSIKTDSQGLANSPWPMRGQNARHTGRVMNK